MILTRLSGSRIASGGRLGGLSCPRRIRCCSPRPACPSSPRRGHRSGCVPSCPGGSSRTRSATQPPSPHPPPQLLPPTPHWSNPPAPGQAAVARALALHSPCPSTTVALQAATDVSRSVRVLVLLCRKTTRGPSPPTPAHICFVVSVSSSCRHPLGRLPTTSRTESKSEVSLQCTKLPRTTAPILRLFRVEDFSPLWTTAP